MSFHATSTHVATSFSTTQESYTKALSRLLLNRWDIYRIFDIMLTQFIQGPAEEDYLKGLMNQEYREYQCNTGQNYITVNLEKLSEKYIGVYALFILYGRTMQYKARQELITSILENTVLTKDLASHFASYMHLQTLFNIKTSKTVNPDDIYRNIDTASKIYSHYRSASPPRTPTKSEFDDIINNLITDEHSKEQLRATICNTIQLNSQGIQHAFSDLAITYAEDYSDHKEKILRMWDAKISTALKSCIKSSHEYAVFYCTLGRFLALKGEYAEAINQLNNAMTREKSSGNEGRHMTRMLRYQHMKIKFLTQQFENSTSKVTKLSKEVDRISTSLTSNIEIVGFFAGIISLILGSTSLSSQFSPKAAGGLIIILLGALLIGFDVFVMLFNSGNSKKRAPLANAIVLVIGAICLWCGLHIINPQTPTTIKQQIIKLLNQHI